MARGMLADSNACDPEAGEQMGMSQASPPQPGLAPRPLASISLAVLSAAPVGMLNPVEPRPISPAPRACVAS